MRKLLLYIISAIVVILVVLFVIGFIAVSKAPLGGNLAQQAITNAAHSKYETGTSYDFNKNGTAIETYPASSRIQLLINGSNQPLKVKAPASFTLSWNIDPSIDLKSCQISGPDIKVGYINTKWAQGGTSFFTSYQGSLEFKNVVPGSTNVALQPNAPVYNGVASFMTGDNAIGIDCFNLQTGGEWTAVAIWIN
ncbi:hypothetical protein M1295_01575 [Patescibacteria group bacterium]|nr:hypothetical protein [Patescibacteria group bacterium]